MSCYRMVLEQYVIGFVPRVLPSSIEQNTWLEQDKEKNAMKTNPGLQTEPANAKRNVLQKRLFISGAALVLLIVAVLIFLPRLNFKPAVASRNVQANPASMDAAPTLGPKTAPVTIIEYGDFGCPSCWLWYATGVLDQLRAEIRRPDPLCLAGLCRYYLALSRRGGSRAVCERTRQVLGVPRYSLRTSGSYWSERSSIVRGCNWIEYASI